MSETPKVIIPGNLKGSVPENIVTDALYILDSSRAKNQKVINDEFEQRIDDIQELAEISIEGGTIQIANAADFNNPTQEQRAKVPTVGAVIDGYTANILPNTGDTSTPIYIDNFHRPQVVTGILLPGSISSQSGNIEALNGGVAARGIASLSINAGGGGGSVDAIELGSGGERLEPASGVITFPIATKNQIGATQLSSTSGTDETKAATPKLVHDAVEDMSSQIEALSDDIDTFKDEVEDDLSDMTDQLNLKISADEKGSHSLPIYIKEETTESEGETITTLSTEEIDSLSVSGNIESTAGGVSARGIADLGVNSGGGGTITQIQINGIPQTEVNGVVNLPAYPSALYQLSDDVTHRTVTDEQIASWTAKYTKPSGGIRLTDLATAVQTSLGKADSAIQEETDPVFLASAAHGISSSDITYWNNTGSGLSTLKTGLTSKGDHNTPIYLDSNSVAQEIDSLSVSGNIESTNGGVSALGIADLSLNSGGGGTVTGIKISTNDVIGPVNGVITLPLATSSQGGDGAMSYQDKSKLDNIEANANYYVLPIATSSALGGIKVGTNLSIDSNTGVLSATDTTYAIATGTSNGKIKITPSSGSTYEVSVYGLGSAAFSSADSFVTDIGFANEQITWKKGTNDQTPFTVGYATNANQLKTSRYIWGQQFNGTADVTGNMTGVTDIDTLAYFDTTNRNVTIGNGNSPANLQSTGGVSALGIADLSINGSGGGGTVTSVSVNGTIYPSIDGLVTLPNYPTVASLILEGLASQEWVTTNFAGKGYESRVQTIESLIPTQATSSNQLADKAFVNSTVNTATASFKGSYNVVSDLSLAYDATTSAIATALNNATMSPVPDKNDYCFAERPTSTSTPTQIKEVLRYKYDSDNSTWTYEYVLNNSGFTAAQWAAIQSGITSAKVSSYDAHLINTSNPHNVTKTQVGLGNVENTALSTWPGSTYITTLGIIGAGTWQGNAIADSYIASAATWNNAVTTLTNLKTGLTSKGAHDLPVYLNSNAQAVAIDALTVPGNIESTNGGVSAKGIADLSIDGGGGSGTLTQIQIASVPQPDVNGVVNLPAYPVIPTNVSYFNNDAGYITSYVNTAQLKVSDTTNKRISTTESSAKYIQFTAGTNKFTITDGTNSFDVAVTPSVTFPVTSVVGQTGAITASQIGTALTNAGYKLTDTTYSFSDADASVDWNTKTKIATVGGTDIHITIPVNPILDLDYSDPNYAAGKYVSKVTQTDGLITVTHTAFETPYIEWSGGTSEGPTLQINTDGGASQDLPVPAASAASSGVVIVGSQSFGGAKSFNSTITAASHIQSTNGNIEALQGGVAAYGIASLAINGGGGSGTLTQIQINGSPLTDVGGVVNIPLATASVNGAMSSADKSKLNGIEANANNYVLPAATANALGGIKLGYTNSDKNYKVELDSNSKAFVYVPWTDTTYESKAAASGGTAVSLVTTGEKYTWNNKFDASSFTQENIKSTLGISDWALATSKPSYAFSEITGTASDSQIPTLAISKISGLQTALDSKLATSLKGAANGLAELDANGLVPSSQLPSYVDDVLEYASKSAFPATGETGKIYVALDTNLTWRWSGSAYVEISPSLALGETSSTAYRGDRGKTAYDHATDASRLTTAQSSGFYKFATTAEGHIASVTAVSASDLTTLIGSTTYAPYNSAGYLPLSGGVISSSSNVLLTLNTPGTNSETDLAISIGGTNKAYFGYNKSIGAYMWNASRSKGLVYKDNGSLEFEGYTVWHSGNDGASSGLNADLLDGNHASAFATAGHTHNYAGSNSAGGPANSALMLGTQLYVNVSRTGNNKYRKISTITLSNRYTLVSGVILYNSGLSTDDGLGNVGFLYIDAYQQNALGSKAAITFRQFGDTSRFAFYAVETVSSTNTTIDLYVKVDSLYHGIGISKVSGGLTIEDGGEWLDELPTGTRTIEPTFAMRVGRADKLTTARSLWGQSFDGSADVTGALHVSNDGYAIYFGANDHYKIGSNVGNDFYLWAGNNTDFKLGVNNTEAIRVKGSSGNVGIGTTAPAYKADINGTANATTIYENGTALSSKYLGINANAVSATKLETARSINGTSFDGSADITTANWGTARNISIADSDSTNTGTAVSVNGSAAVTLKLPATIKATLSGNATSATKATNDSDGNAINTTYFKKTGGRVGGIIQLRQQAENIKAWIEIYSNDWSTRHGWLGTTWNTGTLLWNGNKVWHEGNDGSGSGLDADKLDGQEGSYYATASSVTTLQGYFDSGVAKSAAKLTTVSKTAWGQTFWTSGGVPTSISGDMSNVGDITPSTSLSKNIGSDSLQFYKIYASQYYTGAGSGMIFAASTGRYRWYDSDTMSAETLLMELRRTTGLVVDTDVYSTHGMAAYGIADLSVGGGGAGGTVTSITAGTGLTGGTIIMNGTIALKVAGTTEIGGIQIGFSESNSGSASNRNYAVQLSSNKAFVNVPWTETTDSTVAGWGYKKGMVYTTSTASSSSIDVATDADPTYQYITNTSQSSLVMTVTTSNAAANSYGVHRYVMIYNSRSSATTVQFFDPVGNGVIGPADSVSIPANSYMEFRIIHPASNAKCMVTWSAALKDITTM